MEWLGGLSEFWDKYYPIVLTVVSAVGAVSIAIALIWTKVKPVIDMVKAWFDKDAETQKTDITQQLKLVTMDTQITDLNAKIANPTISDELKQQYIKQLATLETLKAKLEAGLVVVEEKTSKY